MSSVFNMDNFAFWKPKDKKAPNTSAQDDMFKHMSGKGIERRSDGNRYDPSVRQHESIVEVLGEHEYGSEADFDSTLLALQQSRQDVTRLVDDYEKHSGRRIKKFWEILERKRSAVAASKHYHRPSLEEKHTLSAEKGITEALQTHKDSSTNEPVGFDLTLRRLMYGIPYDGEDDLLAHSVYNVFQNVIDKATSSSDPVEGMIVANQIANYYSWVQLQKERKMLQQADIIRSKTPAGDKAIDWYDLPETDIALALEKAIAEAEDKVTNESIETIVGQGEAEIESSLADRQESEQQIADGFESQAKAEAKAQANAYGTPFASGASTESPGGFKARGESEAPEWGSSRLDYIRAKLVQQQTKTAELNTNNSYGIHEVDLVNTKLWTPKQRKSLLEPLKTTNNMRMLLNETRDSVGSARGRVGFPSSDSWKLSLGKTRIFNHPPQHQGDVIVMVDLSGSMGCGCYSCFPSGTAVLQCSNIAAHRSGNRKYSLNPRAKKYPHHFKHEADGSCIPDTAGYGTMQNSASAAIAREIVGSISKRFNQTKVFGFSTGSRRGCLIQEFPTGMWPTHDGMQRFGGGTPTCAAMNFMTDVLAGSLQNTAAIFIADGYPSMGGAFFKHRSLVQHCDGNHHKYLAENFSKKGMRFGMISVGPMSYPANIPNSVHAHIKGIESKEMQKLIDVFNHVGAR